MGDDMGLHSVCFNFCHSAALHYWVCPLRSENNLKRQSVTEPKLMSSPINYPAYYFLSILILKKKNQVWPNQNKQQITWKKTQIVDSVLGVEYDEPDLSSDCCKTICFYKAKLIYRYLWSCHKSCHFSF